MSETINKYLATWKDGRTLVFCASDRRSAGEAVRPMDGKVVSVKKIGIHTYPDSPWPSPLRSDES